MKVYFELQRLVDRLLPRRPPSLRLRAADGRDPMVEVPTSGAVTPVVTGRRSMRKPQPRRSRRQQEQVAPDRLSEGDVIAPDRHDDQTGAAATVTSSKPYPMNRLAVSFVWANDSTVIAALRGKNGGRAYHTDDLVTRYLPER